MSSRGAVDQNGQEPSGLLGQCGEAGGAGGGTGEGAGKAHKEAGRAQGHPTATASAVEYPAATPPQCTAMHSQGRPLMRSLLRPGLRQHDRRQVPLAFCVLV